MSSYSSSSLSTDINTPINLYDYELIQHIGSGSFGCTLLVKEIGTRARYGVLKIMVTDEDPRWEFTSDDVQREVDIHYFMRDQGEAIPNLFRYSKPLPWKREFIPTDMWRYVRKNCSDLVDLWESMDENDPSHKLHLVLMEPGNLEGILADRDVTLYGMTPERDEMIPFVFKFLYALHINYSRLGFVHGDLKPANCVFYRTKKTEQIRFEGNVFKIKENSYQPLFIDFGFARSSRYEEFNVNNPQGGTPMYMPPEALISGRYLGNLDKVTNIDVWSAGLIFLNIMLADHGGITQTEIIPNTTNSIGLTGNLDQRLRVFIDMYFLYQVIHGVFPNLTRSQIAKLMENNVDLSNIEKKHIYFINGNMRNIFEQGFKKYGASFKYVVQQCLSWDPNDRRDIHEILYSPYFVSLIVKEKRNVYEEEEEKEEIDYGDESPEKRKERAYKSPGRGQKGKKSRTCVMCSSIAQFKCVCHSQKYCGKECAIKDH